MSGTTFGGHCYFYMGNLPFPEEGTRAASQAACAGAGAHLVTITSAEEEAHLVSVLLTRPTWIGLLGPAGSNDRLLFAWDTGEPRVYTNWGAGQPDDASGCVVYLPGFGWHDNSCIQNRAQLCERD